MKITNKSNLPEPIVRAVSYSERDTGNSDYTVTELIKPPRMLRLQREHWGELVEDAADRIWSLLGSTAHEILRRAAVVAGKETDIVEQRMFADVRVDGHDYKISGQIDYCPAEQTIFDYKLTSVWAVKDGLKEEWEQQLNVYRLLQYLSYDGTDDGQPPVQSLQIVALLRDWSKREAATDPEYPQQGVVVIEAPLWGISDTFRWVQDRIRKHEASKKELPECTLNEMWQKPASFAVRKQGAKRASKVFDTAELAIALATQKGRLYEVIERPTQRIRCESYCNVAAHCVNFQRWRQQQDDQESAANVEKEGAAA